jgi:hypothetical protein
MKIPVFVSCPTDLNPQQEESRKLILNELEDLQLEPRALGRGDYPAELPLREVLSISRHCAGGIIPGFAQFEADSGTQKKGCKENEKKISEPVLFPTPWNQLEAGILAAHHLPILIFREPTIDGGIFDRGVSDVYIHEMPTPSLSKAKKQGLKQVFLKWSAQVRRVYYGEK